MMKQIDAVIRHSALEAVTTSLVAAGIGGMTVVDVRGFGKLGRQEIDRRTGDAVDFVPNVQVRVIVPNAVALEIVDTIIHASRQGDADCGKIFITDLEEMIRIRTGESGSDAL